MQLLICPGYHSSDLTHAFLQSLLKVITPDCLWVLPLWASPGALPWLLTSQQAPQQNRPLQIIAFSAGVVAMYPLVLAWHGMGGTSRVIAVDGWGMPLLGDLEIYRMSHDRWTHDTTYFPSVAESRGYFYANPAVEHLTLWQSPHLTWGVGAIGTTPRSMTALEFMCTALTAGNGALE
ncbi:MAG: hypothetical protein AAGA46_04885 [Cyanobacteria bacterium P01_F01_bin.13]